MDLSRYLENASDALKRRNYAAAVKIYGQILSLQPDSFDARMGLRQALYKKVQQKPVSPALALIGGGAHLAAAAVCRMIGKHAAAARALERYLAGDPMNESATLRLGDSLRRAGLRKSALAVFLAYARAEPRCIEASRAAGALLYEQGRLQEALEMYEQALRVDPRDQESLKARKDLAAEGALRKTGIDTAQSSRELIRDKEAHRRIEKSDRIQLTPQEIESELSELEERLGGSPDDLELLRRVGRLRVMQDDLQGALDCYERCCRLAPGDSDLQDATADLRLQLQERMVRQAETSGDEDAVLRSKQILMESRAAEYRRRIERNPADLSLRHLLGSALLDLGRIDEAIAELQQSVKDPRHKAESLFLLGCAFQRKDLPDLALGQFEKALQASGQGDLAKESLYRMGEVCRALGRNDEALRHFSRILEQDIGFKDVAHVVEALKAS
ncbi:MAG: hypothetical protein Fur0037_06880 [Planctomycetota bacterium]